MLEVTDATVSLIQRLLDQDANTSTRIRIEPGHNGQGEALITFRPVSRPHVGDVQTLAENLDVFVAPELADTLASYVLDVATPGNLIPLVLRAQPEPSEPAARAV